MQLHSARGVVALALGVVEQRPVHRRDAVEVGDAVALHRLQRQRGLEFGHEGQAGADPKRGVHRDGLAEGVEERQRAEDDVAGVDLAGRARRDVGVAGEVVVGQLGALRAAGGARGVEDHRRVVVGDLGEALDRRQRLQRRGEGRRLDLDQLGAGVGGAVAGLAAEPVPGKQQLRAGVVEVVGDLAPLQQDVHRDDDPPGSQHAVVGDGELGHVRQHHPDPVAGLEPASRRSAPAGRCARRGRRS